jgi:carbon monoxide dehydrogenase subunit G
MARVDFVQQIEIGVPRARLHAFLCDLENYVPLHPLIESIEEISPTDEMPRARRYRVVDRVPFGPFRFRTQYTAALEPVSEREVRGHAWQSPGIRLHTVYELTDLAAGTRLVERVSVEAPAILRRFVIGQARRSHAETLVKMKALLEPEH